MTLADYLVGVTAAEMPASFAEEALKALCKAGAVKEETQAHRRTRLRGWQPVPIPFTS